MSTLGSFTARRRSVILGPTGIMCPFAGVASFDELSLFEWCGCARLSFAWRLREVAISFNRRGFA